jgi:hypothetical protein
LIVNTYDHPICHAPFVSTARHGTAENINLKKNYT